MVIQSLSDFVRFYIPNADLEYIDFIESTTMYKTLLEMVYDDLLKQKNVLLIGPFGSGKSLISALVLKKLINDGIKITNNLNDPHSGDLLYIENINSYTIEKLKTDLPGDIVILATTRDYDYIEISKTSFVDYFKEYPIQYLELSEYKMILEHIFNRFQVNYTPDLIDFILNLANVGSGRAYNFTLSIIWNLLKEGYYDIAKDYDQLITFQKDLESRVAYELERYLAQFLNRFNNRNIALVSLMIMALYEGKMEKELFYRMFREIHELLRVPLIDSVELFNAFSSYEDSYGIANRLLRDILTGDESVILKEEINFIRTSILPNFTSKFVINIKISGEEETRALVNVIEETISRAERIDPNEFIEQFGFIKLDEFLDKFGRDALRELDKSKFILIDRTIYSRTLLEYIIERMRYDLSINELQRMGIGKKVLLRYLIHKIGIANNILPFVEDIRILYLDLDELSRDLDEIYDRGKYLTKREVVTAVRHLFAGSNIKTVFNILKKALDYKKEDADTKPIRLRRDAMEAIGIIFTRPDVDIYNLLVSSLDDPDWYIRRLAVIYLHKIFIVNNYHTEEICKLLIKKYLDEKDPSVISTLMWYYKLSNCQKYNK